MPLSRRLVIFTVLILAALHAANGVFVAKLARSTEEREANAQAARAILLGEHAGRSLGAVDMVLEEIAQSAAGSDLGRKSVRLHMMLHAAAARLPQVRAITILNADGVMIQDSRHYPAQPFSYQQVPNFAEQKKWRGVGLYIDHPSRSKVDGRAYFPMSRPILDSDGNLRGVVVALAEPTYFMSFYGESRDADRSMAALARDDGAILAAVTGPSDRDAVLGMDINGFFGLHPDFASFSTPVPGLPLSIVVMRPPISADPSFRTYIVADVVFMLMLTFLAALATATLVREARRREIAERRLVDAIEVMPAGFTLADAEDRLLICNTTYRDIFGFPDRLLAPGTKMAQLIETAVRTVYEVEGQPVDEALAQRLAEHQQPQGEIVRKLKGNRWILMRWRRTNERGIVAFHTEISQVKQQEEALRAAGEAERAARERAEAADRAKSSFLATMSHELRTPLNAVIGFAELIARESFGVVAPRYRDYAELIVKSGNHLLKIINDILDIAKLQSGKTELHIDTIDVAGAMHEAATVLSRNADAKGISLRCEAASDLPRLQADPTRLQQVLINLLSNAIKFTPAGGTVTMQARLAPFGVAVEITDTGIGIAAADLPKVLEPFGQVENTLTRTQEGTGLGLPLTKNLVELHGGLFEIESEPNKGTTVRVTFPIVTAYRKPAPPPSAQRSVA